MSLRETAKFTEQNCLLISAVSSLSHPLFLPLPSLIIRHIFFFSRPHPPSLSSIVLPTTLPSCQSPLLTLGSFDQVKSSQRCEAVHVESRCWPVRPQSGVGER